MWASLSKDIPVKKYFPGQTLTRKRPLSGCLLGSGKENSRNDQACFFAREKTPDLFGRPLITV